MGKRIVLLSGFLALLCLGVWFQPDARAAAYTYNLLDESEAWIDRSTAEQIAWDTYRAHQNTRITETPISSNTIIPNQWIQYSHYIRVPDLVNPVWFVSVLNTEDLMFWIWQAAVAVDSISGEVVFYSEKLEYGLQEETQAFLVADDDEYVSAKTDFLIYPPELFERDCVPDSYDISKAEALQIVIEYVNNHTGQLMNAEEYHIDYRLVTYSELCDEKIWLLYFTELASDHSPYIHDCISAVYASHAKVWYIKKLADAFAERPPLDDYDFLYVDNQYCKQHIDRAAIPVPGMLLTGLDKILPETLFDP